MVYVPVQHSPSRRSKELAAAVVRLIAEYKSRESGLTAMEIDVALRVARREALLKIGAGASPRTRMLIVAAVIGIISTLGVLVALFGSR
ncbi:MAG: hypothetical protein R3C71_03345 [Candidatus Krumholzibacteriia bacterium]|nr:hypothetical protein [bacterium]MCB9514798.1 hypothetical protein [Candidatus Latescibacterota bacterium]